MRRPLFVITWLCLVVFVGGQAHAVAHGADGPATSTTTASHQYDGVAQLLPRAARGAELGVSDPELAAVSIGTSSGQPAPFTQDFVAAETAGDLAPTLDKGFQFGGAGRSGAGVENFVGPQNAVVRGASQGRVFVTDGQGRVILDVTRDRVKPVVPGQGYVAGDGRKLVPTSEQLGWIDQLWGR